MSAWLLRAAVVAVLAPLSAAHTALPAASRDPASGSRLSEPAMNLMPFCPVTATHCGTDSDCNWVLAYSGRAMYFTSVNQPNFYGPAQVWSYMDRNQGDIDAYINGGSPYYCDTSVGTNLPIPGQCRLRLLAGAACSRNEECAHGMCTEGRCTSCVRPNEAEAELNGPRGGLHQPCRALPLTATEMSRTIDGSTRCDDGLYCDAADEDGRVFRCFPKIAAGKPCLGQREALMRGTADAACAAGLVCRLATYYSAPTFTCELPRQVGNYCLVTSPDDFAAWFSGAIGDYSTVYPPDTFDATLATLMGAAVMDSMRKYDLEPCPANTACHWDISAPATLAARTCQPIKALGDPCTIVGDATFSRLQSFPFQHAPGIAYSGCPVGSGCILNGTYTCTALKAVGAPCTQPNFFGSTNRECATSATSLGVCAALPADDYNETNLRCQDTYPSGAESAYACSLSGMQSQPTKVCASGSICRQAGYMGSMRWRCLAPAALGEDCSHGGDCADGLVCDSLQSVCIEEHSAIPYAQCNYDDGSEIDVAFVGWDAAAVFQRDGWKSKNRKCAADSVCITPAQWPGLQRRFSFVYEGDSTSGYCVPVADLRAASRGDVEVDVAMAIENQHLLYTNDPLQTYNPSNIQDNTHFCDATGVAVESGAEALMLSVSDRCLGTLALPSLPPAEDASDEYKKGHNLYKFWHFDASVIPADFMMRAADVPDFVRDHLVNAVCCQACQFGVLSSNILQYSGYFPYFLRYDQDNVPTIGVDCASGTLFDRPADCCGSHCFVRGCGAFVTSILSGTILAQFEDSIEGVGSGSVAASKDDRPGFVRAEKETKKKLGGGWIALIVIACVVVVAAIVAAVVLLVKKKRNGGGGAAASKPKRAPAAASTTTTTTTTTSTMGETEMQRQVSPRGESSAARARVESPRRGNITSGGSETVTAPPDLPSSDAVAQ